MMLSVYRIRGKRAIRYAKLPDRPVEYEVCATCVRPKCAIREMAQWMRELSEVDIVVGGCALGYVEK